MPISDPGPRIIERTGVLWPVVAGILLAALTAGGALARGEDTRGLAASTRAELEASLREDVRLEGRVLALEHHEEGRTVDERRAWDELRAIHDDLTAQRADLRAVCAATKSACGASR